MNNQRVVEVTVGLGAGHEDLSRIYQSQELSLDILFIYQVSLCIYDLLYYQYI